jgi:hypothetical protein
LGGMSAKMITILATAMPDELSHGLNRSPDYPDIPSSRQKRAASFHFPGAGSGIARGAKESLSGKVA